MLVIEERPAAEPLRLHHRLHVHSAVRRAGAAVGTALGRRLIGKPLGVWLLWLAGVCMLLLCPAVISDPGMWPYLLDPELLALVAIVGLRYTWWEATIGWTRLRVWWLGRASRTAALRH